LYVVVRAGGKQFRVAEGETISVPGLTAEKGAELKLDVLAFADDGGVRVGTPRVDGVTVTAEVTGLRKGDKIDVLKYKNKVRYRKRQGHRQSLVDLRVTKIAVASQKGN
jgi:large subunit ribosomal protein L21